VASLHFLPQWVLTLFPKHGFIREGYIFGFLRLSLFTIFVPFLIEIVVPPLVYSEQSVVVVATYEGVINPVSSEYLHDAIKFAETEKALCLVFQLDTPGGLDTSMRSMIKDMTASQIPIVVYISPSGGRATSAGVFITLAAHIAAMAPGTTIGAAHPVAMGGAQMDEVMKEKVENDSVAYIHSIAEQRGRNVNWAEDAVRKSVSATDTQAKELRIIDLVVPNLDQLLQELHGREIKLGTKTITLATENYVIREFPMGWRLEVLKAISDPNIAYVLMTIGMIGLMAELYNPGAILPGIVGGISLIMAFYSLQTLPVNYAGVFLVLLGMIFLVLEITVMSYGLLAIGGIISMILGSILLMNEDFPFYQISWTVILPMVTISVAFTFLVLKFGVKALRERTITGSEGMVGQIGLAKTNLTPKGKIFIHGELWNGMSEEPVEAGHPIEVTHIEGLTLHVKPASTKQGGT